MNFMGLCFKSSSPEADLSLSKFRPPERISDRSLYNEFCTELIARGWVDLPRLPRLDMPDAELDEEDRLGRVISSSPQSVLASRTISRK